MGIHPIVVIWLCGFAVLKEYSTLGRILAVKKFSVVPQFNTAVRKLGSQSSITLCLKLEMVQQISISLAFQLMCVSATSVPLWLTYIKVRSSLLGVISHHQAPTGEGANPQLFEMAPRRNIQSHFWAFRIQCNIGSKLEQLTNFFSRAYFLTEIIKTLWDGKEDASLARNNFLGCLETLELL